jgi:ribonucleoside-diphosphate reductase alpha chain
MPGGQRRAAHIAVMNVNHPDIEKFIVAKQGSNNNALTQFNISVGITDDFMNAVKEDKNWDLTFKDKIYKTVRAKDLYDLIAKNAFEHNEPGIFNLDHVNRDNNGWYMYDIQAVNPCGEIPLVDYGVCCLGALNLTRFVHNAFTDKSYFDFDNFKQSISHSVRFLDNVLSSTEYPLDKIKDRALGDRKIGLGFTGLADAFVMMGVKYGSEESKHISEEIGKSLRDYAYDASIELAKEKGSFPNYDEKILESGFVKRLEKEQQERIKKHGIRNVTLLTTAPTGTTSFSLGQNCSSGIEPIFSLQYDRKIRTGKRDETFTEVVYDYAWLLYQEVTGNTEVSDTFVTTMDVDPYDAIDIQAIFQKYIDSSISKTANLPLEYTFDEYKNLFNYAYEKGLKGFTSFNPSGSVAGILSYSKDDKKHDDRKELRPDYIERGHAPKRPQDLECDVHQISVNKEKHVVLIGKLNGSLYEVFVTKNTDGKVDMDNHKTGIIRKEKSGYYTLIIKNGSERCIVDNIGESFDPTYASLSRFISMSLRHGVPLQFIVDQLQKDGSFVSFEKAVSRVLKKYIKEGEKVMTNQKCPECSSDLVYRDGCVSCSSCGWSQCS